MSQNDFVIANQTGSAFRSDVNGALQALASLSSGAAAPGTTYAYQLWLDTTTGLLKRRNSANNAWITIAGGQDDQILSKAAAYTIVAGDGFRWIAADAGAGAFTLTLPDAATVGKGWEINVIRTNTGANAVTVARAGSDTILLPGGAVTSFTLTEQHMTVKIYCDGSQFYARRIGAAAGFPVGTATGELIQAENVLLVGKHSLAVNAASMLPATTAGCGALSQAETATNKINYQYLPFDPTAIEYAHFSIPSPKSYNAGTVQFLVDWAHPATATNFGVVWGLEILAVDDNDALDTAWGTKVNLTDTGGTTEDFYQSALSGAVTPGNVASKEDRLYCRLSRQATDGSDTLAVDAHLLGVKLVYTVDAGDDS